MIGPEALSWYIAGAPVYTSTHGGGVRFVLVHHARAWQVHLLSMWCV